MDGKVILIDGVDGAGKTTLVSALVEKLEGRGKSVYRKAFPSHDGEIGKLIRRCFEDPSLVEERTMLPLFIADGFDFDMVLEEAQMEFDFVILDRHPMVTTWAYQAGQHSVSLLAAMTEPSNFSVMTDVDAIFIIDVPPEVSIDRRSKRGGDANPLFEKGLEYAELIRTRYQSFAGMYADNGPVGMLDGTIQTSELVDAIIEFVDPAINH